MTFTDLVDDRSSAFHAALAAAPDLDARVPGCPDWALRDLVRHLGRVQRFWALAVTAADPSGPPGLDDAELEPHGNLVEWAAESTALLLGALRAAQPGAACWAWWPPTAAPLTVESVARHQVQEAAVHAFDAQQTIGAAGPLPGAVAVDGVAEFLTVCLGALGEWPHRPARVVLSATDGPSWTVDFSPAGARLEPAASGEPVATVHAPASDLVLALYGRVPFDDLRVDGDRGVLAELRGWARID
jgi:uncharacterized protein (TIGR03083 family)